MYFTRHMLRNRTMNTELLSLVDENEQVIESLPRSQIHKQGLRHQAVHILVFNRQGHFFLQKRSMQKELNKGLWDNTGSLHTVKLSGTTPLNKFFCEGNCSNIFHCARIKIRNNYFIILFKRI